MKYVIIGGVAGGATTAARLRRNDEHCEIIMIERGEYVSYANCGLPYYIGGVIKEREKLFVQTVKGFEQKFNIEIRPLQEVTAIDRANKQVTIKKLESGEEYAESYDKLVLSPGAAPLRPRIEGIDDARIFTLRNVPDTDAIKKYVDEQKPRRAVIVGGGFIGLEAAENLHQRGVEVSIVEMADQVMAPIDFSMAAIVHQHLVEKGVHLHLGDGVKSFGSENAGLQVHLNSGSVLDTDMVLLSIGVRPETKLAQEAGLTLGERGGISVNEYMQTSDADIYALGDAVEVTNLVTGKPTLIPLAGPANKQGRIVADNLVEGNRYTYKGSIGTSIAKVFDLTVAAAGANAKTLKREGIEYVSSYTHSGSWAGYYPGSVNLSLKIIFAPTDGRLLGAQVVGFEGVDKRVEMLAQVIQHAGTVYDLAELEHAYAPPYSAAKDPVNMAGMVAENILKKKVNIISWRDVANLPSNTLKIDVRTPHEFSLGSMPGFINVPQEELRKHLSEWKKDTPIVVTCAIGLRGYLASRILLQNGFTNVSNVSGGYKTWCIATAPVSQKESAPLSPCCQSSCEEEEITVDACGLMCPGPVMKLNKSYESLNEGAKLVVKATDTAFGRDVRSWCKMTGAELISVSTEGGIVNATIRKQAPAAACPVTAGKGADNKTLIVFSDDLDKALASFVIANGAAATGKKVTMFFTFWGLNVIKKEHKPAVKKDIFGKMFGMMLPSSSKKLKLSKMNMGGMGSRMMRYIMKDKHVDSLELMRQQAIDAGVEMIACTMSMDVMGVKREELLDNVELSGVAGYLERAEESNVNLFI